MEDTTNEEVLGVPGLFGKPGDTNPDYKEVKYYQVSWNPKTDRYVIYVWMEEDAPAFPLNINTPEEFTAVFLMLNHKGVVLDQSSGYLHLPSRRPGE